MSFWTELGFKDNLYSTPPLGATVEGSALLVGRDVEVAKLHRHWDAFDTHASMEGDNGVGKTSLVAVAAYRSMVAHHFHVDRPLLLPLTETFQMTSSESDIEEQIYFAIARSIIHYEDTFKTKGVKLPDIDDVHTWLSSPILKGGGASASVLGFGGSGSYSQAANSAGFSQAGFREVIRNWLRLIFPSKDNGAFVGVIDNLELLETSQDARRALESMRDTVLALPGVRWVLCGANGIVRSSVGSQRLTGVIADPIRLAPLSDESIPLVVQRRIEAQRIREDATPPVEPDGFAHLYAVAGRNLRNALKHAQDFSAWLYEESGHAKSSSERRALLDVWLAEQADRYAEDTQSITQRGWQLFDDILVRGGSCSPGSYEDFGFNSPQRMRPYVKQLEDANLVHSSIDESDQRRRTIVTTSNGWVVHYQRAGYPDSLGKPVPSL